MFVVLFRAACEVRLKSYGPNHTSQSLSDAGPDRTVKEGGFHAHTLRTRAQTMPIPYIHVNRSKGGSMNPWNPLNPPLLCAPLCVVQVQLENHRVPATLLHTK